MAWQHQAKRWLYLTHRWVGIVTCLLFAMWFASGLVMIYVPYPSLSLAQKLAGAQAIDWRAVDVPPPLSSNTRGLTLEMRDGQPVWRIEPWGSPAITLPAHHGAELRPVDGAFAARVAQGFGHAPARAVEQIARDQWTVAGGFDRHRPLWKVSLADAAGTQLYVSSSSGAVVQATTGHSRFWNWLGSVPHWLYPTVLRQDNAAWRQVVLWVSGPCIAGALAGIWIGLLRTRMGKRRFKGGRMTPYHGWMLWHHVAGLGGGLFLLTWIFSGWLSVDPGRVFQKAALPEQAEKAYAMAAPMPPVTLERLRDLGRDARQIRLSRDGGLARISTFGGDGQRKVYDAATGQAAGPADAAIARSVRALVPSGHLIAIERLTAPDAYWYDVGALPRLPILRLRFDDPAQSWLHIDPETGAILEHLDARRRTYRWLFDLLHKWDLNALTHNRPIWDIWLWVWSLLGLVTSVSGVWIGWKRLRRA
ncbi:hypothetical protein [Novosphingobium terrae]|uniref:hypothetical protein n=1 Tax=Novosphingobium terrae TaxID=2726189 RepID=UPI00197F8708|nr:hypothetical protein [Novosphingobium terrae]